MAATATARLQPCCARRAGRSVTGGSNGSGNGGLLHLARSADHHRKLAAPLQHDPTARIASLQTSSAGGLRASPHRVAGFATSTGSAGHAGLTTSSQLTFDLDHSMKAAPRSKFLGDVVSRGKGLPACMIDVVVHVLSAHFAPSSAPI